MYETEKDLEKDGVDVKIGPATFVVARAGGSNRDFKNMLLAKSKPLQKRIKKNTVDADLDVESESLMIEVYSKTVIKGWSGVTDRDGNEFPFTVENCIMLLSDLPDLFTEIQTEASDISNFQNEIKEEDLKKS